MSDLWRPQITFQFDTKVAVVHILHTHTYRHTNSRTQLEQQGLNGFIWAAGTCYIEPWSLLCSVCAHRARVWAFQHETTKRGLAHGHAACQISNANMAMNGERFFHEHIKANCPILSQRRSGFVYRAAVVWHAKLVTIKRFYHPVQV